MTAAPTPTTFDPVRQLEIAKRAIAKHSFCVLATSSAKGRPHAVGILYAAVDLTLYFLTSQSSVKARNVAENRHVAVSIPVRKYPVGPPMAVQFQGHGEVLAVDDPQLGPLLEAGRLRRVTGLNALRTPGTCFLKVVPHRRISTYGLGIPITRLVRNLALGARTVELP